MIEDIALDEDGDLLMTSDFVIEASDEMHIEHILKSFKSEWKESVLVGVGLNASIKMPTTETKVLDLKKEIKLQLEYDDYRVNGIDLTNLENIVLDVVRIR